MRAEFTATTRGDVGAVARLLETSFQARPDAPFLNRSLLFWKYYDAGPQWPGSRSFVMQDGERLVAHAAVWPLQIKTANGVESGLGFYDWASSPDHPGVGLTLLKKLTQLTPFMVVVGGAEVTRRILPRMGFEHWSDIPVYARLLRPWQQLRARPANLGWKEPARLLRNTLWNFDSTSAVGDWAVRPAELAGEELFSQFSDAAEPGTSTHDARFLEYLTRCPTVPFRCFTLYRSGEARGYFVISCVGGQSRLACLQVLSREEQDWSSAVALAVRTAAQDPSACELAALGSAPLLRAALESNGFRLRDLRPLCVHDPAKHLAGLSDLHLSMLDDDSSFLHVPDCPFLT